MDILPLNYLKIYGIISGAGIRLVLEYFVIILCVSDNPLDYNAEGETGHIFQWSVTHEECQLVTHTE